MTPRTSRRFFLAKLVLAGGLFSGMVAMRGRLDAKVLAFGLPIVTFLVAWAIIALDGLPAWLDRAFAPAAGITCVALTAGLVAVGGLNLHTLGYAFMFCGSTAVIAWLHWDEGRPRPVAALPAQLREALAGHPSTRDILTERMQISQREARQLVRATLSSRADG